MKKVMIVGNFDHGWDGSICDERNIGETFAALGWTVFALQREEWRNLPDVKPDFVLLAQWNGYGQDFVWHLKGKYDCPVIYWAFDYQWDSNEKWHFQLAKDASLFLSKELDHKADYEKMGVNFQWFPQDFAPNFLDKPSMVPDYAYDVVFTGTYLPQATFRNDLLKAIDNEFDLHIFSVTTDAWIEQGFSNVHGPILDHDLPKLYNQARVNVSVDWKQAQGYWSDRMAQIMCCGGYVLNKFVPGQELLYPSSVDHFNTIDEAIKRITWALHESSKVPISWRKNENYEFAQSHLKAEHRVKQLVTLLKGLEYYRG